MKRLPPDVYRRSLNQCVHADAVQHRAYHRHPHLRLHIDAAELPIIDSIIMAQGDDDAHGDRHCKSKSAYSHGKADFVGLRVGVRILTNDDEGDGPQPDENGP